MCYFRFGFVGRADAQSNDVGAHGDRSLWLRVSTSARFHIRDGWIPVRSALHLSEMASM